MKKTFALLFGLLMLLGVGRAQMRVPVDFNEGVELMGLVFRLAGAPEYNYSQGEISGYVRSADSCFAPFHDHAAVKMAHQLRTTTLAYDAVASYGQHLVIHADGTMEYDSNIAPGSDDSFDRWSEENRQKFLPLLEAFYKESRFADWYASTADFRQECKLVFATVEEQLDVDWFAQFFGPLDDARFNINLSIFAGVNNYGCSATTVGGTELLRPVIGCMLMDEGHPVYSTDMVLPIVVHEFCHAYCNPLIDAHWSLMGESAKKIFKKKSRILSSQAYTTPRTMMNETFVRSSVIAYLSSHGTTNLEPLIKEEEIKGFVLTRDYVDALLAYMQHRTDYATMKTYMPRLIEVVNGFNFRRYEQEQARKQALMVQSRSNIKNGAKNVPSGEYEIRITFSKPMDTSMVGVGMSAQGSDFPQVSGFSWSEDARTLILNVVLQPNHRYGFGVLGYEFRSQDGSAVADNAWEFKTK